MKTCKIKKIHEIIKEKSSAKEISTAPNKYPGSPPLLETARDEYTKELDRFRYLDNKASFFMTTIVLVGTLFIPSIPFRDVRIRLISGSVSERWVVGLLLVMLFGSIYLLIAAFVRFYKVYNVQDFNRFDYSHLAREGLYQEPLGDVRASLSKNYSEIIRENALVNEAKSDNLRLGIKLCGIGFLLLLISAVGLMIMI